MCLLAYVTAIFGKHDKLNKSMQGKNTNLMHMRDRTDGFRGKRAYWRESISKANLAPFPQLSMFLKDNRIDKCSTKGMCSPLSS